jgi:hypothetical protein
LPGTTLPGQDPGALDDKDMLSFMGSGSHQQDFWVSPRVYNHLFHQLAPVASSPAVPGSEQEVVIASGWMGQDDSITLQPWYQITATPGATISGTYAIEAVDVLSQPLASQGFDVSFVLLSDPPAELDSAPFHVGVASPPGTEAFRIKKGETVLEVVHPSPNAPGVTITNPGPGETVSGTYAITWDATDLDGDQLNHLVEYSHDSQEWLVLAGPITETQIVADFSVLPGGDQARVRVWTSDGVNTAEATSGAFLVATKPPKVYLDAPASGTCHPAGMNLTFSGAAYDLQDGWLRSATALVWTSDRDGTLGGGEVLYLHDLSVGRHTITLSATNSADQTTVADTELMIGFCQYLPLVWRIGD